MRTKPHKNHMIHWGWRHRALAALIIFSLCLSHLNLGSMVTYATDSSAVDFQVGGNITASLSNGILTLSGSGDTLDYSAETAPFLAYADQIHTLVIESGVTYIGDYLFYGLGHLQGELTLPETIVGFGDFAFSGGSRETSPSFSLIRNLFEKGEISLLQEFDSVSPGDVPQQTDELPSPSSSDPSTQSVSTSDTNDTVPGEPQSSYRIETITMQEIQHSDTLFYPGQSGRVICSPDNVSFLNASLAAGYRTEDSFLTVILDDMVELQLPLENGQIILPDCPEEILAAYRDDTLFTYMFAGWIRDASSNNGLILKPGDSLQISGQEPLLLYSFWESSCLYELQVKTELFGATAAYTLIDGNSGQSVSAPPGYSFTYQWQTADDPGNSEAIWADIEAADASVYCRMVDSMDSRRQFRCQVTAVRQTWMRTAEHSEDKITLYSEAIPGTTTERIVYVSAESGNDEDGKGTKDYPYKTFDRAADDLLTAEKGGTVENNKIVIMGSLYTLPQKQDSIFTKAKSVPVSISGELPDTLLRGWNIDPAGSDFTFDIFDDIRLESIKINYLNHIYGNGNNITIGDNFSSLLPCYLYGSGQSGLTDGKVGKIAVYSGKFVRIAGYVRNNPNVNADGAKANITVGGTADVTTIISGSASGGIANADVTINICESCKVTSIVGGNQGFQNTPSPYSGKTAINITGGTVEEILGAGSGRGRSIPSFSGSLSIRVTGGSVKNIYGAGSAAYILSPQDSVPTTVNIAVSGGIVENIFAAGKGADSAVVQATGQSFTASSDVFGSLSGQANISVTGEALVTGNIYASGKGVAKSSAANQNYDTSKNAYLNGSASITIEGNAVIKGSIYGGGKGIKELGYEECARITEGSAVKVLIKGGTVEGSVYGGGELAQVDGSTSVEISGGTVNGNVYGGGHGIDEIGYETFAQLNKSSSVMLSGGTVKGNIYGGGQLGRINSKASVTITNGTVNGSVYGGSLGIAGKSLVSSGSTLNMTGGWVQGNLYGGSEYSDDGSPDEAGSGSAGESTLAEQGLVFVNLTGGTVNGKVFGGGYQGKIYGSTHLHIGLDALEKCSYYKTHPEDKPKLNKSALSVSGSVYAGGDFGGDTVNYDAITITGTSHVYIDGNGYHTGDPSSAASLPEMKLDGGVFGSGASCDAGSTRLVTLDHYGYTLKDDSSQAITGTTRALTSIQRADRVLLIDSHVQLTGQSDIANTDQTALYSLNRIGDHPERDDAMSPLGIGLVLQSGSTLLLDSASIEMAAFKSVDSSGNAVTLASLASVPNTLMLTTGTVFRVSTTANSDSGTAAQTYGPVTGYSYIQTGDTVSAYAYARIKTNDSNKNDGGFVKAGTVEELPYTNVTEQDNGALEYRYWQVKGESSVAKRNTVLTVRQLSIGETGYSTDGYSVAKGIIELPPANKSDTYTIESITIPGTSGLTLVEAAKSGQDSIIGGDSWITAEKNNASGSNIDLSYQQNAMLTNPMTTFGLYMKLGSGFTSTDNTYDNKIISQNSALSSGGTNTALGQIASKIEHDNITPEIEFYLTYYNDNINTSRDLGEVEIKMTHTTGMDSGTLSETIYMYVDIVTKASSLSEQTVDLYATQNGTYTGRLNIPQGSSRTLTLASVTANPGNSLVKNDAQLTESQFAITMKPVSSNGWKSAGLMTSPYDLGAFTASSSPVPVGTTDSRYEAPIEFTLKNLPGFSPKENPDTVTLLFKDGTNDTITVTLLIHWEASVVSSINTSPGKHYNTVPASSENITLSQNSSFTAGFTLAGSYSTSELWLEIQNHAGEIGELPGGTKISLLIGRNPYIKDITAGTGKIALSEFRQMWGTSPLTGTLNGTLTVIMDFETASSKLPPGQYSLRLRNNTGADSMGAAFTVNNNTTGSSLSCSSGLSRGEYTIALAVFPNNDTRLSDGAAAVLSLAGGEDFPEGTVFHCSDGSEVKDYYPDGGSVYLPLTKNGSYAITMDTIHSAGLTAGDHTLEATVFSAGCSAGEGSNVTSQTTFTTVLNPSYSLSVSLDTGSSRSVKPGDVLNFTADYSVSNFSAESVGIKVRALLKAAGGYEESPSPSWGINGNSPVLSIDGNASGKQTITVTAPDTISAGTYRLLFTFGDQEIPFNIIVTN